MSIVNCLFIYKYKQSVYNVKMKDDSRNNVAVLARLNELMEQQGISKADMARIAGVSPQAVNNWFNRGDVGKRSAQKLAQFAGVSVDWILGDNDADGPNDTQERPLSQREKILLELFNELPDSEADLLLKNLEEKKQYYDTLLNELLHKRQNKKA
ncbi:Phage transcriptional regulator [Xenorhabdus bovienii str. oregonense]|uniref:Phage transcriptional regulator n=1 Tax=Xenorhabdus bovienii str. oregonense TaxID=1398202 RepID=A0A077P7D5_XENBV|nr:helix-turn-helix domain-containing protein [Xenorhabdus bovienii]CDH06719.1 Phage transcriptional regulator [Xenorhabdus bovienii str. oregonense]